MQASDTAEIAKWLGMRIPFFKHFWLRIRVRKKNVESSGIPHPWPPPIHILYIKTTKLTPLINFLKSLVLPNWEQPETAKTTGGQNQFFRLRLHSCSTIFECGPESFQIWESDSCSDSSYHRSNRNIPIGPIFLKKWPRRLLLVPKLKSGSGSGSGFSQYFDCGSGSGSERKAENPAGVVSGTPDLWPPLQQRWPPYRNRSDGVDSSQSLNEFRK